MASNNRFFSLFTIIVLISKSCFCTVNPPITSCNVTDVDCITDIFNKALKYSVARNDEYGIDDVDPLFLSDIIGDFPTGNYQYTDNTITGLKEWTIRNATLSPDYKTIQFVLDAPGFKATGVSNIDGYFISIPVLALGPYVIDYGCYEIFVYSSFELDVDDDGNIYGQFGDYLIDPRPISPTVYNYSLILSEGADITDLGNELISMEWRNFAVFSDRLVIYPIVRRLLTQMNQYFQSTPPGYGAPY